MRQRRNGLIINIGSLAPVVPTRFHAYLSAAKAAVNTYTDALRLEVRPLGIAVTTVEPGAIATHPGERFTQLKVAAAIGDYTEQETPAPARYYLVGSEKWYARLGRILPPSAMESLAARHFQLAKAATADRGRSA